MKVILEIIHPEIEADRLAAELAEASGGRYLTRRQQNDKLLSVEFSAPLPPGRQNAVRNLLERHGLLMPKQRILYREVHDELEGGTSLMVRPPTYHVVYSKGHNPLGYLIRKATKSEFSHVVVRRTDSDSDMVFEAWGGHRCSIRPYEVYLDRKATVLRSYTVLWNEAKLQHAWDSCLRDFCDVRYAFEQLPGDLFAIWADRINPRKYHRNPFASKALVCSELVLAVLRRATMPGFGHFDRERVEPDDIDSAMARDPAHFALDAT